jgi:hypothetical protein
LLPVPNEVPVPTGSGAEFEFGVEPFLAGAGDET